MNIKYSYCTSGRGFMASMFDPISDCLHIRLSCVPEIKKVIFNDPATIILWSDETKTVVKCGENDIYDPEKGLAMAIAKKALGNKGNYYNEFKKWLPEEETDSYITPYIKFDGKALSKEIKVTLDKAADAIAKIGKTKNNHVNQTL